MTVGTESAAAEPASAAEQGKVRGYARSTVKHGAVYLIGTVLSRVAGLIMLPVYTRYLSPREYGVLEILGYTTDVVSFLAGLGIGTAVMRFYWRAADDAERREVVSTAALLLLGIFVGVGIAGMLAADRLSLLLLGPDEPVVLMRLAVAILVVSTTIEVPMTVMKASQRSSAVVVTSLTRLLTSIGLSILFVVVLRMGVAGVLLSTVISSTLVGGYLLVGLFRESGMRFSRATARALARFGAPIVVWELGSFVLHFSDRYFLRGYHSLAVVGVYSLSYKLAQIIPFLVTGPFSGIWLPKALEIEKREGPAAVPILAEILRHYNLVLISVSLGMALFAGDVIRLVTGAGFHDADRPIPILALAMVFFGYRQVAQIGALIKDRPGLVARSTSIAAAGVVAFNILLIPRYGMMGAAVATLAGFALEFSIMRWHSMRVYALRIEYGLGPIALAALAWLGAEAAFPGGRTPLLLSVAGRFAAFSAFVGALVLTGIITPDQRRFLTAALRHPVRSVQALRGA